MNCRLCNNKENMKLNNKIQDYLGNKAVEVYKCKKCDSHYIGADEVDFSIYDKIYSNADKTAGYDRYYRYAHEIKNSTNPAEYLKQREPVSYFILSSIKNLHINKNAKILEVGCGFGYLTYAIKTLGFDIHGLDISNNAITFAKENFGDYYSIANADSIEEYIGDKKFDLIVSTELIEHIESPYNFIKKLYGSLNKGGSLLISTPNKSFYAKDATRVGDLPPVHLSWLTTDGFEAISKEMGANFDLFDFNKSDLSTNYVKTYLETRKLKLSTPNVQKKIKNSIIYKLKKVISILISSKISCKISNSLSSVFLKKLGYSDMGVIITKPH